MNQGLDNNKKNEIDLKLVLPVQKYFYFVTLFIPEVMMVAPPPVAKLVV